MARDYLKKHGAGEPLEVPEWGVTISVISVPAKVRDAFWAAIKDSSAMDVAPGRRCAGLVCHGLLDEAGQPYTVDEIETIDAAILDRLFKAVCKASGMEPKSQEVAKGES